MNINMIGVPIYFGSDIKGVNFGPDSLRESNIIDILENENHNVYDCGNIYVPKTPEDKKYEQHSNMKYLKPIIEVNKNLAHQVYSSLLSNCFPLIIGGDHSLGLGSISGASKYFDNLAVIWVDAHGDLNTFETSPSGNIHGMPLAAAMGLGYEKLTNLYFNGTKVKPENVFVIGARDLDEGEKVLIKEKNLSVYSTEDVNKIGIENIMKTVAEKLKSNNIDSIHVSFDIDCLDPEYVPGTGTPVKHGFTIDQAKYILKFLGQSGLVKSMDIVELNTLLDVGDVTINNSIELIEWAFKYIN